MARANNDTSREMINLRSALNHSLDVFGVVTLMVTVGEYSSKIFVVLVRRLREDFLLSCSYISYHVSAIMPRCRAVVMPYNTWAPIQSLQALKPIEESLLEKTVIGSRAGA